MSAYLPTRCKKSLFVALAFVMTAGATACGDKVPRPSSDASAPSILLNVTGAPHANITLVPGGNPGQTNLSGDAQITPTINLGAVAEDPHGVKNVLISGEVTSSCIKPGTTVGQAVKFLQNAMNPDPGQSLVLTKRVTILFHDARDFATCQPGFSYDSHTGIYTASAVNFSDTVRNTAIYTVIHAP